MTLRRWLKGAKPPPAVRRQIEEALANASTGTEVDVCDNCGASHFVNLMADHSTQERRLLLCRRCDDRRTSLLAAPERHRPTEQWSCLCGQPLESPIHYAQEDYNG